MADNIKKLGNYTILEQLGSGAFGWVYKATDPIGRTVAIKVLKPGWADDPQTLARFQREALVAGGLFHNRIATVLSYEESDGRLFLVMRYVDGDSLDKIIAKNGRLTWKAALEILSQAAEGLDYAHQRGLVHRDIKPANILVSAKEGAVLTDFGLVKAAEASGVSSSGAFIGSPAYIAPETWNGKAASPATDIYSLGCVVYEMLTGKVLFHGESTPEIMTKHMLSVPALPQEWPEGIPAGLNAVLGQALEKEQAKRCQNALHFVSDLKNLEESERRNAAQRSAEAEAAEKRRNQVQAQAVETARREAEQRELAQARARAEAAEKAERDGRGRVKSGQSSNTSNWVFGLVGLGLGLGVLLLAFLVGRMLTGGPAATQAAQAATTVVEVVVTQVLSVAPTLAATEVVPTSEPTQTALPVLGVGSMQTRSEDGMQMVYVPAGPFTMGSEKGNDNEKPVHEVNLDAFWIDRTEVTNGMFQRFVDAKGYQTDAEKAGKSYVFNVGSKNWEQVSGANWQHPQGPGSSLSGLREHPVVHVSWQDASAYCGWAGSARLPSEAEWEKAARGTDGRTYPWGEMAPNGKLLNFADVNLVVDWADKSTNDGYQFTAPVGSYADGASPYGAMDMAGNVWEWVADWYAAYPGNMVSDSNYGTTLKVLRGGSWDVNVNFTRSVYRDWFNPTYSFDYNGFRCARSR